MDVKDAIEARRSIRKYERRPIGDDDMAELLEAMRLSPSSSNLQKWTIVVVTDKDLLGKLVPACGNQRFVGECGALLVGVTGPGDDYHGIDITIAMDHLSLRAVELGLGTCWRGDFEPVHVKELLGIPMDCDVPICMTVGHPASIPAARKRKPASELFRKNHWDSGSS